MVDKDYFDEICTLIYGKSEVCFYSENNLWTHHLDHLVESFAKESLDHQAGQRFMLDCLGNQILVELLRSVRNNMPLVVGNHPCPAKPQHQAGHRILARAFQPGILPLKM